MEHAGRAYERRACSSLPRIGLRTATAALCGAAVLVCSAALSQTDARKPDDTEAFRVALGMSYFGFDLCGDQPAGALFRRAVI